MKTPYNLGEVVYCKKTNDNVIIKNYAWQYHLDMFKYVVQLTNGAEITIYQTELEEL